MYAFLKKVLWFFILMLSISCESNNEPSKVLEGNVIVIDSCEYICYTSAGGYSYLAHKGNCKFCAERRKEELKEMLNK